MRYLFFNIFFTITIILTGLIPTLQAAEKQELVLLSWSEYMDETVLKAFETQFNASVKEVFFESDENRTELLITTGGTGYDVVIMGGYFVPTYVKQGWLAPITPADVPNLKYIEPRWFTEKNADEYHSIPYLWGTLGIVYRKDLVGEEITSWQQLFHPKETWRGKIMMSNDSGELIGSALKALGYPFDSEDRNELAEAEKLLLEQKPFVERYNLPTLIKDSELASGKNWLAMTYNGDALTLRELSENPNITFVIPKEGTELLCDQIVVLAASKNKALAFAFVNFITDPKQAAQLANTLNYATPNQAAKALLSSEHLNNPFIYPSETVLAVSGTSKHLGSRARKKRNEIYSKVAE